MPILVAAGLVGWALGVSAEDLPDTPSTAEEPVQQTGADPDPKSGEGSWETPIYVPPLQGKPAGGWSGGTGGTRGPQHRSVSLLAPSGHHGLTTSAQPTLYWHLEEVITVPVEFVLQEEDALTPLVLRTLPTPAAAGFQAISLREIGVTLRPNVVYEWSIALVADRDRRSRDLAVAQATIQRIEPPPALLAGLSRVDPRREVNVYVENQIWYDAIDAVSRRIQAMPNEEGPRRQRAALLRQAGLDALAAD